MCGIEAARGWEWRWCEKQIPFGNDNKVGVRWVIVSLLGVGVVVKSLMDATS